jgi:hypothetical protein
MYTTQSHWLKLLTSNKSLNDLSKRSTINRTRLIRIIRGDYELTLREAYILGKLLNFNFFHEDYLLEHFYGKKPE